MSRLLLHVGERTSEGPAVIAFPPAGSGTEYFHDWIPLLSGELDLASVRLPGRQDLWDREPVESLAEIVGMLSGEIAVRPDGALIILGVCTGGLMAYELAHRLLDERPGSVRALVLNGTPLPTSAARGLIHRFDAGRPYLSRARTRVLRDYYDEAGIGDVPDEGVDDEAWHAELMDEVWALAEPRIRADIGMTEFHSYDLTPLDIPIVAIRGDADNIVSLSETEGWAAYTNASFTVRQLAGGHFLMQDRTVEFAQELIEIGRALRHANE